MNEKIQKIIDIEWEMFQQVDNIGILNSLEDNIQTNMTQSEISSLVRMQLGDMTGWTIQRCSLTGSGMMTPVYSIPNYSVYVMVPDESSISEAKTQINSVMGK